LKSSFQNLIQILLNDCLDFTFNILFLFYHKIIFVAKDKKILNTPQMKLLILGFCKISFHF